MKKIVLSIILATGFYAYVAAQDTCMYYLTPDVQVQKEVMLKSTNEMFDLNLMIGVKWLQIENKIQLIFDRKTVTGNDLFFLLLSMSEKSVSIKDVIDCKSGKKTLWSKLKSEDSKYIQYFINSDNLKIDNYMDCYKSLANNNEEEFVFELEEFEDFKISLPGFFVVKTEKKPWYSFSKKDKRVLYKTKPYDLHIQFERIPVVDTCSIADRVVAYIEAYKNVLDEDSQELLEAKKNGSCIFFNLLKDKIRRTFVELNDKCERYTNCEAVATAINAYNDAFENIFKEECVSAPVQTSNCTLSTNELTSINNRLRNLQMKINVKKRNNDSTDDEFKEYRALKAAILPRITADCRRSYKQAIDALESYCVNIESLF
jgi:hypothetical protein